MLVDTIVGRRLEYVQLGHAIALGLTGGFRILIEAVAHLDSPAGSFDVEPGDDPSDSVAILLGDVITTASTRDTGELEVTFTSGSRLLVDADTDVESWAITGPERHLIVCVARGELAVWGTSAA